ncbi:MAG TPA: hypothetical protein VK726_06215 [Acetobacteraceae bacterium]|nr:hypothetical protein [Acetobacteraceae bacterium]
MIDGITVVSNTNGTLILGGTTTAADDQAALDSIKYSFTPSDGDPTDAGSHSMRTVDWKVTDASASSSVTSSGVVTNEPSSPLNYGTTIQENGIVAATETVSGGVMTLRCDDAEEQRRHIGRLDHRRPVAKHR